MSKAKDEIQKVAVTPQPESAFDRLQTQVIESLSQLTLLERDRLIGLIRRGVAKSKPPKFHYEDGKLYRFRVSWGKYTEEIEAPNSNEATSTFCERTHKFPPVKLVKVELLGEVASAD